MRSTCLFAEVKQQCATLVLEWVTRFSVLLVSLMASQLEQVEQNPFLLCLTHFTQIIEPPDSRGCSVRNPIIEVVYITNFSHSWWVASSVGAFKDSGLLPICRLYTRSMESNVANLNRTIKLKSNNQALKTLHRALFLL